MKDLVKRAVRKLLRILKRPEKHPSAQQLNMVLFPKGVVRAFVPGEAKPDANSSGYADAVVVVAQQEKGKTGIASRTKIAWASVEAYAKAHRASRLLVERSEL